MHDGAVIWGLELGQSNNFLSTLLLKLFVDNLMGQSAAILTLGSSHSLLEAYQKEVVKILWAKIVYSYLSPLLNHHPRNSCLLKIIRASDKSNYLLSIRLFLHLPIAPFPLPITPISNGLLRSVSHSPPFTGTNANETYNIQRSSVPRVTSPLHFLFINFGG